MAKTAKLKHDTKGWYCPLTALQFRTLINRAANPRSRASKRATSPSINVDKSVRDTPRASDATPALAARPNGGITKPSKKKQKPMKRGQRVRHEKGLARAEAVQDRLAKKVDEAASRQNKRKSRKAVWEEVNNDASKEEQTKPTPKVKDLDDNNTDHVRGEDGWEDEPMMGADEKNLDVKVVDGVTVPASAPAMELTVVDRTAFLAGSDLEEFDKIT